MHFALLGIDHTTAELVRAAMKGGHTLAAVYDVSPGEQAELRELAPGVEISEAWEDLLGGTAAVLVARAADDDRRAEQLRRLVQGGVPMIVAHPVHQSMLVYYELDMIRQESRCPMLPYTPQRWHPAVERLAELAAGEGSPIGRCQQVACERLLAERSKKQVLAHFVQDVEVLRLVAGELNKIGAMASAGAGLDYANLGVQMSGPEGVLVRWSVGPAEAETALRLTAIGPGGKILLTAGTNDAPWTIEIRTAAERVVESYSLDDDSDPAAEAISLLSDLVAGADVSPTWFDAARDLELADAIERSVARGRTIDLHFEEQTEHNTFKGMMAAGGCFLLVATLAAAVIASLLGFGGARLVRHWPVVMAVVLGGFLLLQFLRLVFPVKRA